jgi:hypothetical protein
MKSDFNTSMREKTRLSYYVHGIMCRVNKLREDNLPNIGKIGGQLQEENFYAKWSIQNTKGRAENVEDKD